MKTRIIVSIFIFTLFVCSGSVSAFTESTITNSNDYFGYAAGGPGGSNNSFFGRDAGNINTGDQNTFIGIEAGRYNTSGYRNTFNGSGAGYSNTTGALNTFNGSLTGHGHKEGNYNTFNGADAGSWNEGNYNTFNGYNAGSLSEGSYNTFNGYEAGYWNYAYEYPSGYYNTFNGWRAGKWNETADRNTFNGADAGYSNTTGSWNTFNGVNAGMSNTEGERNTFNGYEAGFYNTTGDNNTFNGPQAGYSNTTGFYNTFNGSVAGYYNTGGHRNTFNGYAAGFSNEGNSNTFIGAYAGYYNTTGSDNTFNGYEAGYSNTTGSYNTFNGYHAGLNNTTGSRNTFNGYYAGRENTTGSRNTIIGYDAGESNTTGIGNVFLGHEAGWSETGSDRLYIDNSSTSTPLIYGEFDNDIVVINGALTANSFTGDGSGLTGITVSDADKVDGLHASAFATASHAHSGVDITSGTVADAYVDPLIARDSEIMPTVLANDGIGSTIDADLLDGQDSTAFMSSSTDNWVDTTGDTMTGDLIVEGSVEIDLDLFVNGNTYLDSDETLKKDIKTIESSVEKIKHIRGVSFAWKESANGASARSEGKHYGVIAQDVEQVLPEIVKEEKNSTKKVAYMELIPVLIEVVKEQQKTITKLQEENSGILKKLNDNTIAFNQ